MCTGCLLTPICKLQCVTVPIHGPSNAMLLFEIRIFKNTVQASIDIFGFEAFMLQFVHNVMSAFPSSYEGVLIIKEGWNW